MRCESCGAPVTEAKCLYCGRKHTSFSAPESNQSQETLESMQSETTATSIEKHVDQVYKQDRNLGRDPQLEQDQNSEKVYHLEVNLQREQERAIVRFILCFFFGIFGAHYFYDRRPGLGLLYLFTWGLLGIGWLVDCIRLLIKMIKAL